MYICITIKTNNIMKNFESADHNGETINIIYTNVKFAEFLGAKFTDEGECGQWMNGITFHHGQDRIMVEALNYDNSFDSLMQVVEKIESFETSRFSFSVTNKGNTCVIAVYDWDKQFDNDLQMSQQSVYYKNYSCDTKLESLYRGCFDFIQWYEKEGKILTAE